MKRLRWLFVLGILALGVGAGAVAFTVYDQYWRSLPPISNLLTYDPPVATRVYADNGQLVGEFFFEKRYLTPIEKIPPVVRDAFVAAEDSEFYEHPGIDVRGILRAFLANVQAGSVVQGGSTITQQVVKQLLLTPERSYRRKLREIMLSVKLERELTKDEILYLYLNRQHRRLSRRDPIRPQRPCQDAQSRDGGQLLHRVRAPLPGRSVR
jgi:penicillin-binding protein 1A